jgi:hypothetical protein
MKRANPFVLCVAAISFGAGTAQAQLSETLPAAPSTVTAPVPEGLVVPLAFQQTPPPATPQGKPAPLQNTPTTSRRLASMVGYIDDPVISSKVRLRYELGYQDTAPDRAEFFYAKCGCYRSPGAGAAFDPNAPGPAPGAANDVDFRQFYVEGEYAPSRRLSVFAELPVRTVLPQSYIPGTGGPFPDATGIGDLRIGAKVGLSGDGGHSLTGQVKAYLPTGAADKGLGTDHWSVEPAVLFLQQFAHGAIEAEGGFWLPVGGSKGLPSGEHDHFSGNIFFWGIGPSVDVVRTRTLRLAPVVELVGWHVLSGFQTVALGDDDAAGTKIYNIKFGARFVWNERGSFYVGYGKALTDATWYDDIVRFEYRQAF